MMNPEVKAKWVAALRSGQFKQNTGSLKRPEGHCCLGVLCEVSQAEIAFGVELNLDETGYEEILGGTLMDWSGVEEPEGDDVLIEGNLSSLAAHNDAGKTFAQIADAIEEQL